MCPRVLTSVALTGVGLLSWFPVRRWYRRWGATDAEIARTMPGDADVPQATYETTLAVTVHACSSNSMRSLLRRLPAWTVRLLVPRYVTVGDV